MLFTGRVRGRIVLRVGGVALIAAGAQTQTEQTLDEWAAQTEVGGAVIAELVIGLEGLSVGCRAALLGDVLLGDDVDHPPMASAPYRVEAGPRITSMRSTASSGGMWLNWLPLKLLG